MAGEMKSCPWEPIEAFSRLSELNRFEAWIREKVNEGKAVEIPVGEHYQGVESLSERWFRHVESDSIWRLVNPDFPFQGLFEKV